MKKYRYTTPYPADTFRFELKSVLGSELDGCYFNGKVEESTFKIYRNSFHILGVIGHVRGFPCGMLAGEFHEENGKTHVTITPKYSTGEIIVNACMMLLFFVLGVAVTIGSPNESILYALFAGVAMCLAGVLIILLPFYVTFVISTRLAVKRLKKTLKIEMS